MEVIYGLIPMMLLFGFLVVLVFIWMAKKGYFDDMDGQASRILMDDDEAFTANQKTPDDDHSNGKDKGEDSNPQSAEENLKESSQSNTNTAPENSVNKTNNDSQNKS